MMTVKKVLFPLLCFCAFSMMLIQADLAQGIEISSSMNPVGSGARATGMGGAFIGVADDATAASWNPAGLIQLEKPEFSLVYSGFQRDQSYTSISNPELNGTNTMDANGFNYASVVYPFLMCNSGKGACRNAVVSLSYQRMYEMDKDLNLSVNDPSFIAPDSMKDITQFQQTGFLYALSPAMAVQMSPTFSLGITLNFWKDYMGKNGWESKYIDQGSGVMSGFTVKSLTDFRETVKFEGENAHIGFLWNATGSLTIGGVYKSAFDARLTRNNTFFSVTTFDGITGSPIISKEEKWQNLKMPASYGIGTQYRPSDSIVLALDLYRTEWSRFIVRDSAGNEFNGRDNASLSQGRLKNTTQVRLGTEYLFIGQNRVIALRAGVFSDPEPERGRLDRFHGFTIGTGYSTGKYALDASYQYRTGKNVTSDVKNLANDVKMDVTQQTVMVSGIYYF